VLLDQAHVHGVAVWLAEDGDTLDTHAVGGAHDTACNLAAVGDEDLLEH